MGVFRKLGSSGVIAAGGGSVIGSVIMWMILGFSVFTGPATVEECVQDKVEFYQKNYNADTDSLLNSFQVSCEHELSVR
jgi:hypothetical protein